MIKSVDRWRCVWKPLIESAKAGAKVVNTEQLFLSTAKESYKFYVLVVDS